LLQSLNISRKWLCKPVELINEHWSLDPDFKIAERFAQSVKVVNDTHKRGIKLISDFATIITTDPVQRDAL